MSSFHAASVPQKGNYEIVRGDIEIKLPETEENRFNGDKRAEDREVLVNELRNIIWADGRKWTKSKPSLVNQSSRIDIWVALDIAEHFDEILKEIKANDILKDNIHSVKGKAN